MKNLYQTFCLLLLTSLMATGRAQVAHHLTGISIGTNAAATVQLDGSVSNLFSLTASMRSQYLQMFDIYPIDASPDLTRWTRQATLLRLNSDPTPLSWQDTNIGQGLHDSIARPQTFLSHHFQSRAVPMR